MFPNGNDLFQKSESVSVHQEEEEEQEEQILDCSQSCGICFCQSAAQEINDGKVFFSTSKQWSRAL